MSHSTTSTETKIRKYLEKNLIEELPYLISLLVEGKLKAYESHLKGQLRNSQNFISQQLLPEVSEQIYEDLVEQEKPRGGRNIIARPLSVRTETGYMIKVWSPYVKRIQEDRKGSRHLLASHWAIIGGASPCLYDKVSYFTAIGPSYDIAHQTLNKCGTKISLSSTQDISNRFAVHCFGLGEENIQLAKGERLVGKRVVISIDGGRTRCRFWLKKSKKDGTIKANLQVNKAGNLIYETKWKEPKLFVITVLDNNGNPSRYELPIYGCRFEEKDVLDLLERYLRILGIAKAKQVQIIADGALWIWDKMKPLLLKVGVPNKRIVETLDYYHASEYIHRLVKGMPKRIDEKQRKSYLKQFKELLWEGRSARISQICETIYKRPNELVSRWMNYLSKHQNRTQYAVYEKNKLMCGSGIIESAIRRIINLRFKNTSTFWKPENVEKLYFLRAALLSKRWEIVMENISNAA